MKAPLLALAAIALSLAPMTARTQTPPAAAAGVSLPHRPAASSYQRSSLAKLLGGTTSPAESLSVIVFMVSFADEGFGSEHDTMYYANELRHVREYFLGASRNIFSLRTTLYRSTVELSGTEAYYGDDDLWKERMAELLIELVEKTDAYVDFSRYDAFAIIHADAGQETDFNGDSEYQIASGFVDPDEMAEALKDTLGTPGVPTNDGAGGDTLFIDNLMVWPEEASQDGYTFGALGIYAYQVGLRLGMLPLYDTTPDGFPDSQGIGDFDLMSYGIYNALGFVPAFPSAFNRLLMGWVEPVVVDADAAVRLADVSSPASLDTVLVKIPLNASEYYLVENRVHDTNFNGTFDFIDLNGDGVPENEDTLRGAEFDFFLTATSDLRIPRAGESDSVITGSGLMVYHVDEGAIRRALDTGGYPNDDKYWKGVDIEEADHIQDLDSPAGGFAFGSFYDSFRRGNNDRFGPDTDPSSADNAGVRTGLEIDEISAAAHYMAFRVRFSPAMDYARGEFPADIARLSPIAVPIIGSDRERLLIAADSASIYLADVGLASWNGEVEKLNIEGGGLWTAPPIMDFIFDNSMGEMYVTSSGGVLHGYSWSGAAVPIDDDGTPGTLKLRGDASSSLIVGPGLSAAPFAPVLAFSSSADSTYLLILGYDGAWPGTGWVRRGTIGIEFGLMKGQIASHPAYGIVRADEHTTNIGVCIATYDADRGLCFNFIPMMTNGSISFDPANIITKAVGVFEKPTGLFTISTGDIDRDGSDEMVAAIDGAGLYYYTAAGALHHVRGTGSHFSPPILVDVDGDGTLETALRDESHCCLYSGFGVPASGWPIDVDAAIISHEWSGSPAPPIAGDVDGDGGSEVVFLIGGDIHAFDFSGREIDGWPLPGEGARGGALALLYGEAGAKLYIADCASALPVEREAGTGGASGAVSSIRRYSPGVEYGNLIQEWRTYRHDPFGYGRQDNNGGAPNQRTEHVDPSTFIVYPNPAAGASFTVRLLISAPARVRLTLFNLEGEKVASLERAHDWLGGSAVPFEQSFSTAKLSGGIYICRIEIVGDGWSWSGSKKFAVIR
jgi:M6 family metalloprotease-like protein